MWPSGGGRVIGSSSTSASARIQWRLWKRGLQSRAMSAASARHAPAPIAGPCTGAITGWGRSSDARNAGWRRRRSVDLNPVAERGAAQPAGGRDEVQDLVVGGGEDVEGFGPVDGAAVEEIASPARPRTRPSRNSEGQVGTATSCDKYPTMVVVAANNRELTDFLRRARGPCDPSRAGLPADGRVRRVPACAWRRWRCSPACPRTTTRGPNRAAASCRPPRWWRPSAGHWNWTRPAART